MHKKAKPAPAYPGLPDFIAASPVWAKVETNPEYASELFQIRKIASTLGGKTEHGMPEYTDHSVQHMDSLWKVAESILLPAEIDKLNPAEAFLLGATFYVHDLGMASLATDQGREQVRATKEYEAALSRLTKLFPNNQSKADERALKEATRDAHAKFAAKIATEPLPSLGRFLIERSDFRERWAYTIGKIGESHNWDLDEVERSLGQSNATPGPDGYELDLAYIACIFRIIDFAHITRERAPRTERALRAGIRGESQVHWDAQENITPPARDSDMLKYGCTKPIPDIEAWWKFYDMASDLDKEIRGVAEFLRGRTISAQRFSLQGVKGAEDPAVFNRYVLLPPDVVPVDIRVQPDSMDRVVDLLGGKQIYGQDQLAPIRELIQNCCDAIELRLAYERAAGTTTTRPQITTTITRESDRHVLSIRDNGIGMSRTVVRKYLLGVGSDFWNSPDFHRQFSNAADLGFQPIGKFGIGFLSVFMLGDNVEVETETRTGARLMLTLNGVGRRGELRERPTSGEIGTDVRIILKPHLSFLADNLTEIVRARAPMLNIPVEIRVRTNESTSTQRIMPGWWKAHSEKDLISFLRNWQSFAHTGKSLERRTYPTESERYWHERVYEPHVDFGGKWTIKGWPEDKPQTVGEKERLFSLGGDSCPGVVRCSQGIAVDLIHPRDVSGIIDVGRAELTVSRESVEQTHDVPDRPRRFLYPDIEPNILTKLKPAAVARLDELGNYGMIPARIAFIRGVASIFGPDLLPQTKLNWIPVTTPPGNLTHLSKSGLLETLRGYHRVLLTVGVSQGGGYAMSFAHLGAAEASKALLIAISTEEVNVQYDLEKQLERETNSISISGPLDSVLDRARQDRANLILTDFLVRCVSEGWGLPASALQNQRWVLDFKSNILWADLNKAYTSPEVS